MADPSGIRVKRIPITAAQAGQGRARLGGRPLLRSDDQAPARRRKRACPHGSVASLSYYREKHEIRIKTRQQAAALECGSLLPPSFGEACFAIPPTRLYMQVSRIP